MSGAVRTPQLRRGRNTWSWGDGAPKPSLGAGAGQGEARALHDELGEWRLYVDSSAELLFCDNETNNERLFGAPNVSPYPKDSIDACVVGGRQDAANPEQEGTKC